jgi:hypothetical protein
MNVHTVVGRSRGRLRSASLLCLSAVFAACGGGSRTSTAPPSRWECLRGAWELTVDIQRLEFGVYEPTGLELTTLQLRQLDSSITDGLPVFLIESPAKPRSEGELSAVVIPAFGGGEWFAFGGLYYSPASDITVDLGFGTQLGSEFHDRIMFGCDSFRTFSEFTLYAGDVLLFAEIEPGVFAWTIRDDAEVVGAGVLEAVGRRQ